VALNNPYSSPQSAISDVSPDDELYDPQFFSLNGRIGRVRYLAYGIGAGLLMMLPMAILAGIAAATNMKALMGFLIIATYIAYIVATIIIVRRRLHDLDTSGWMALLMLVPLVNAIFGLWLVFGGGTKGSNRFGPAPSANTTGVVVLAWVMPAIMVIGILAAVAIPAYSQYSNKARAAAAAQQEMQAQQDAQLQQQEEAVQPPAGEAVEQLPAAEPGAAPQPAQPAQ
jgi:uncharacterized membrane protein YhaH (DUF805 family)